MRREWGVAENLEQGFTVTGEVARSTASWSPRCLVGILLLGHVVLLQNWSRSVLGRCQHFPMRTIYGCMGFQLVRNYSSGPSSWLS
jgi:hypothetical protein